MTDYFLVGFNYYIVQGSRQFMFDVQGSPNRMPIVFGTNLLEYFDDYIICVLSKEQLNVLNDIKTNINDYIYKIEQINDYEKKRWKLTRHKVYPMINNTRANRNFDFNTETFQIIKGSKYAVEYLKKIDPYTDIVEIV